AFGDRFPISFSAGIDPQNFADAVSLGLVPITVCSDLLRPGGYGRMQKYFSVLGSRMKAAGASDLEHFILGARGHAAEGLEGLEGLGAEDRALLLERLEAGGDLREAAGRHWEAWLSRVRLLNTRSYVAGLQGDPRYGHAAHSKVPKKVGSTLVLLDCLSCDKCVPVCPNDANFTFVLPKGEFPCERLVPSESGFRLESAPSVRIEKPHQIGNFADFCNECGNCDVFCPEDGGPYVLKPRFFGSHAEWVRYPEHDGFFLEREGEIDRIWGRFEGETYRLEREGEQARFDGEGFELRFEAGRAAATAQGRAARTVDLTYFHLMEMIRVALLDGEISHVNA
ncbi:MAG: glutamate synthase, partial [Myxococcales bacterium]|nr:glutamate synthase [Myxococcales bacterium]